MLFYRKNQIVKRDYTVTVEGGVNMKTIKNTGVVRLSVAHRFLECDPNYCICEAEIYEMIDTDNNNPSQYFTHECFVMDRLSNFEEAEKNLGKYVHGEIIWTITSNPYRQCAEIYYRENSCTTDINGCKSIVKKLLKEE